MIAGKLMRVTRWGGAFAAIGLLLIPRQAVLGTTIAVRQNAVSPEDYSLPGPRPALDGRYLVLIEVQDDPSVAASVTLLERKGKDRVIWRRHLRENEIPDFPSGLSDGWKGVTDDGNYVVLRLESESEIRVFDHRGRMTIVDCEDLLESRRDVSIREVFVPDGDPPVYAIWSLDGWKAIPLNRPRPENASQELAGKLDEIQLKEARAVVDGYRFDLIGSALRAARDKARRFWLGFDPLKKPLFSDRVISAYRLIASKKLPETRWLAQDLLGRAYGGEKEEQGWPRGTHLIFEVFSPQRALGDEMLALLEGKPSADHDWEPLIDLRRFQFLGGISGYVHLPFKPVEKAGDILVYLYPEEAKGHWQKSTDLVTIRGKLHLHTDPEDRDESFEFYFGTLAPGDYRLRGVWDRRPGPGMEGVGEAGPGDYVSAELGPFRITAGLLISNLVLECTNRAGAGENYYEADAVWARKYPGSPFDLSELQAGVAEVESATKDGRTIWPPERLILKTNQFDARVYFRRVIAQQLEDYGDFGPLVWFEMRSSARSTREYSARVWDAHGCVFEGLGLTPALTFPQFPGDLPELVLEVTEKQKTKDLNSRFTLKNPLVRAPADLVPLDLPQTAKVGTVTVRLVSLPGVVEEGTRLEPVVEFSEEGWGIIDSCRIE